MWTLSTTLKQSIANIVRQKIIKGKFKRELGTDGRGAKHVFPFEPQQLLAAETGCARLQRWDLQLQIWPSKASKVTTHLAKLAARFKNMFSNWVPKKIFIIWYPLWWQPIFTGANFARVISAVYSGHFLPRLAQLSHRGWQWGHHPLIAVISLILVVIQPRPRLPTITRGRLDRGSENRQDKWQRLNELHFASVIFIARIR